MMLDAHKLSDEVRNGSISAEDFVARLIDYIRKNDESINAFITINDKAIDDARAIDRKVRNNEPLGLLAGVPVAVKDNICTKGLLTTCASKVLSNFIPPYDATAVRLLKEQDAIIIGKTNMDEFGMGSSTEFSFKGATRNPYDLGKVVGGSSGGSAAAIAAEEACLALGTDTGGSVRCPAAFCSCIGLKPTYGLISRYGLVSYANSLETIGILARCSYDAALALKVIANKDNNDNTTYQSSKDYLARIDDDIKGLKIALVKEMIDGAEEQVRKSVYDALDRFAGLDVMIDEISIPSLKYSLAAYYTTAFAEASSNLARYDGIRYGYSIDPEGIAWNRYYMLIRSNFGEEVKRRIMLGTYILSSGYYGKYYLKAQKVRSMIKDDIERAFKKYDILASPTMPIMPYNIGERINDPLKLYLSDVDTVLANLTGIPAISIPCYKDAQVGLQLLASHDREDVLLNASHKFEVEVYG